MQIKPHQIKHFAEQQRRFTNIRSSWKMEAEEEGSYFSKTVKVKPTSIQLRNALDVGIDLSTNKNRFQC